MKLLILPSWFPSKSYPNNGIFFKEQTEALKKAGIDTTVLCIEIPYRKTKVDYKYFKKNFYIENGVKIYRYVYPFSFLHRMPILYYFFLNYVSIRIYKKELKKENCDIILAHSFLIGGFIATCIKKRYGTRCVTIEHSSKILRNTLNYFEKIQLRKCVNVSDGFVCVSENLRMNIQKLTNTKKYIWVHPNMINSIFKYKSKEKSTIIFTSIGNLIPLKRMDYLIKAFCNTFTNEENVHLEIIGDGPEKENLQKIINQNNRNSQITLHGLLDRKKVASILQKSHVMALLSEKETFGIAYIEALATGNIIIGTDNGGANDIITSENGILIEEFSIEEIEKTLRKVYLKLNKYDHRYISQMAIEKYGEKRFVEDYIKFLNERLTSV